jgi:hypothetical protein
VSDRRTKPYKGEDYPDPEGFILIPRRWWEDDPLLQIKPWHPALFWQYLVFLAVWRHSGKVVRRGNETIHLERGQLYYSLRYLGMKPGWDKNKVSDELEKFTRGQNIPGWAEGARVTLEPRFHGTVITILNYDPYQDLDYYLGTDSETGGTDFPEKGGRTSGQTERKKQQRVTDRTHPRKGRTSGRISSEGRDARGTNKKAVQGSTTTPCALARDRLPNPWTSIRAAVDNHIWEFTPASARRAMIVDALGDELPPRDLARFVRDQCNELDLPFPDLLTVLDTDSGEAPDTATTEDPEPDHDTETRTRELADELRGKLARLKGTRA